MACRHRFLTTRNLHWQWFNALVFGLVPQEAGGVSCEEALAEVEAMKAAAMRYASTIGGWSDQIGLFVNVFGHNSVNCLFIHILDMSCLGPSFKHFEYKNLPLDAVLLVLRQEGSSLLARAPSGSLDVPALRRASREHLVTQSAANTGTNGATSLKAEIVASVPELCTRAHFRAVRRLLAERLGGVEALLDELCRAGFVDRERGSLTTGTQPFNIFARCASGVMEQPGMAEEQEALGEYKDRFMICKNRPENDEHWDSEDPEWVGKASMSRRHRFLTTRNLHWQWFNCLVFGMVPSAMGGGDIVEAVAEVEAMKAAALTFTANVGDWSDDVGLYFHVFGHNSVNSLHLHILDLRDAGPTFQHYQYKNCPLDAVLAVLKEELRRYRSAVEVSTPPRETIEQSDGVACWENASKLNDAEVLELNVGGVLVAVSRSVLLKAPTGSKLRQMFDGSDEAELLHDSYGRIFLDLPPESFQVIVNRLRLLDATCSRAAPVEPDVAQLAATLGVEAFFPAKRPGKAGCAEGCFGFAFGTSGR